MGGKSRFNATNGRTRAADDNLDSKIQVLEKENRELRGRVERLVDVNRSQLSKLTQTELVSIRVRELETKLLELQTTSIAEG